MTGAPSRGPSVADLHALSSRWGIDLDRARLAWRRMHEPAALYPDAARISGCPEALAVVTRCGWSTPSNGGRGRWSVPKGADTIADVLALRPYAERLRYDEFSDRVELLAGGTWGEVKDHHARELRAELAERFGPTWAMDDVHGAIDVQARRAPFHPVRSYLRGLRWDGTPRLNSWLRRYAGCDTDTDARRAGLYDRIGAAWMISAVARVERPGCQADCALVLAGPQGFYKSSALAVLGGDWYSASPIPMGTRDGEAVLQGAWVWELAELASVQRSTVEAAKAYLTERTARARFAYQRRAEARPRQTVFAGTVNPDTEGDGRFLHDPTGSRRFWTVPVRRRINVEALADERDQLWAEAAARFAASEPWWLSEADERELVAAQTDEQAGYHPWAVAIGRLVRERLNAARLAHRREAQITTDDALEALGIPVKDRTAKHARDVGHVLRTTFKAERRTSGRCGKVWILRVGVADADPDDEFDPDTAAEQAKRDAEEHEQAARAAELLDRARPASPPPADVTAETPPERDGTPPVSVPAPVGGWPAPANDARGYNDAEPDTDAWYGDDSRFAGEGETADEIDGERVARALAELDRIALDANPTDDDRAALADELFGETSDDLEGEAEQDDDADPDAELDP